ncbi:unnamed protein product [Vicia faba]|uniref:Uncharacterized protein n=1 Tax=Vicia faba TaxID=3906 RepID=A0AAV0ZZP2_VICFA|nr:unnamed protein product [Vicia faba]
MLHSSPKPQQKPFAGALNGVCDTPISQLPQPILKGDRLSITIPEDEYQARVESCKHNLHGRVLWPKCSKPLSTGQNSREVLRFLEEFRKMENRAWNLSPGILKSFPWSKDFMPNLQQNNIAQV